MKYTISTPQCSGCGKFCIPWDEDTPFGCNDPENPEPLDPYFYCNKCSVVLLERWRDKFKQGYRGGDWQKSNAEIIAAKENCLMWVHDSGRIDPTTGKLVYYQYIPSPNLWNKYME